MGKTVFSKTVLKILFFVIIAFNTVLTAQYRNFKSYSIDAGLPNSNIYAIYNDSRGVLWIGSETGLCNFNGLTFKYYTRKNGLPGNWIRAITEDKYGRIWVGTDNGLSIFDGKNFTNYAKIKDTNTLTIYTFFKDSRDNIWIGTSGQGAYKASLSNNKITFVHYNADSAIEAPHIFGIAEANHKIYLGSFGYGIYVIDSKGVTNISQPVIPSNHILSTWSNNSGQVFFSTYNAGVFQLNSKTDKITSSSQIKQYPPATDDMQVWKVLTDKQNNLWLGTNNAGIGRLYPDGISYMGTTAGLPSDFIYTIYQDNEKNLWYGTLTGGLIQFLGDHFSHFNKDDGLIDNVTSIIQQPDGTYYLGTTNGLYHLAFNKNKPVIKPFDRLGGVKINSMLYDKNGYLWIGTGSHGVFAYRGNSLKIYNSNTGLINNEVVCIFNDSQNRIWVGTIGGISIIKDDKFFSFDLTQYGFSTNEIQCIAEDKNKAVWIATLDGLIKMKNNQMISYDEQEGLFDKKTNTLTSDYNGNIWVGTSGGTLYRINPDTTVKKPFIEVANSSHLSCNSIYSLLFYDPQMLLCGTDKGMVKISLDEHKKAKQFFKYDRSNGFIGEENIQNSIYKDRQNQVWMGTVKCLTKYNPKLEEANTSTPHLQIEKIKLFFKDYYADTTSKKLNYFKIKDSISFAYNQNHITLQFSGISLRNPSKVEYSYMLEGLETTWSPPRQTNEAVYAGLKPGKYCFKLKARGENGLWSAQPLTYSFEIRPPFWMRWWFYLICSILGLTIFYTYVTWREKKLREDKAKLEQIVLERTTEVVRQKNEIESQRDEISRQHDIVQTQNKDITDSIMYAERIQKALMTKSVGLNKAFNDYFVLFRPRNIVSGDFFWFGQVGNTTFTIAADCTGHGVPGAFMSMLGMSMLNKIVIERNIISPAQILNELRNDIICSLQQNDSQNLNKDGMDITIVAFDKEKMQIHFAGANNPLLLLKNGQIIQTKGDKMPVAIYFEMKDFQQHTFDVSKGDRYYLMSDGYEDQFGGPNGKKFMSKRLNELILQLANTPMGKQEKLFAEAFEQWKGDIEQVDDVLLMGFEI
ncbi:MAG TPA: two-component regulator propeller domain-containing protein [Bacteroidales bacterium]|nr:two-component regulator propeller domain-containing protein [Bacteroidales bacterium]